MHCTAADVERHDGEPGSDRWLEEDEGFKGGMVRAAA